MSDIQCATLDRTFFYYYRNMENDLISQHFYLSDSRSIGTNSIIYRLLKRKYFIKVVNFIDQPHYYKL